jgi:hypothetical protein
MNKMLRSDSFFRVRFHNAHTHTYIHTLQELEDDILTHADKDGEKGLECSMCLSDGIGYTKICVARTTEFSQAFFIILIN